MPEMDLDHSEFVVQLPHNHSPSKQTLASTFDQSVKLAFFTFLIEATQHRIQDTPAAVSVDRAGRAMYRVDAVDVTQETERN